MIRSPQEHPVLRVVTWNIHKGVQGLGPAKRLEIHNIGHAIEQLDADLVCLQEVRFVNRREQRRFAHWPEQPQADFLAPEGYEPVYRTNAITRHGEHGNALLSRWPVLSHQHEDMSDHRFEQRGLLHTEVRFRVGGFASLRKKLGLSAAEMGKLIGVSAQSVYHWETGKTKPRASQLTAISAVRKMGKKEVAAKLGQSAET